MKKYVINGKNIHDWKTFHFEFKNVMQFPNYYGENMDAWIDCMCELSEEPTMIYLENGKEIKKYNREIVDSLLECAAFVNLRRMETGDVPNLIIAGRF